MMKNAVQRSTWWETIGETITSLPLFAMLALPVSLFLGVAIAVFNLTYGIAIAGALIFALSVLLRWDAFAVALVIAVHLFVDWYLALHLVGILMAVFLLFVYYFGRGADHPWGGPRPFWLWALFLVLTIYPAIYGGQFMVYDAASFYPSDVLGAFLLFWIGCIISKDVSILRRVLQLLSLIGTFIAIHTIIETTTGVFLFATSHESLHLATSSNLYVYGMDATHAASRSASFFVDPNWNGCFLAMMFFLPLGLFMESKSWLGRLVFFAEMIMLLVALLFTYSSGAWIAFSCGIVIYTFLIGSHRQRLLWIFVIALIAFLILTLLPTQLAIGIQKASAPYELSMREGAWETGIRVIEAFPLFGVGLGGQAYLIRANPYVVPAQLIPLPHPHNTYIQWGAMAGIPVLIVFLLLLGYSFWCSWRNWRLVEQRDRSLLGGAITALLVLSINSWSIDGWTNFAIVFFGWLIFGMLASPLLYKSLQRTGQPEMAR